jgi:hypothetical protein
MTREPNRRRQVTVFYVRLYRNRDWHIEDEDVDTMLCGENISAFEGDANVRTQRPIRVCPSCDNVLTEREKS